MIKTYTIILILFFFSFGFAQQEQDSIILPTDTSSVLDIKTFDTDLSEKYIGEEFDYSSAEGDAQNLLSRFLLWIRNALSDTFGVDLPPGTLKVVEYIIYVLMGVLALYLLVKFLVGENLTTLFSKRATPLIDINLSEEHIEHIDLDILIKEALVAKNYRLAIRYHYLSVLKNLSLRNIIEWQFEKTNSDYQNEITIDQLKPLFQEVSYLYDYIWYGEQDIDENKFNAAETRFAALKNSLPK